MFLLACFARPTSSSYFLFLYRWNEHMRANVEQYAERAHDDWSHCMIDSGWVEGSQYDEMQRCHPSIKPFSQLPEDVLYHYCFLTGLCI